MTIPYPLIAAAAVTASTDVASRIVEEHSIGLPAAVGIAMTVFLAARWLERRFTRIEDRLDNLPCQNDGRGCEPKDKDL